VQELAAVQVKFVVHRFGSQYLWAFYTIAAGGVLV
jgi:hypothetical protein